MAPNILTTITGLNLLPLFCGTVVEHYWNRINALPFPLNSGIVRDIERGGAVSGDNMKREELLYHEVFAIIKDLLARASWHTIEELQGLGDTGIPSPPWVKALPVVIPMLCCDKAAKYLIEALGGEPATKRIVGGTHWWQVRGIDGVNGEWIVAKKGRKSAQQCHKSRERKGNSEETGKGEGERSFRGSSTNPPSSYATSEPDYTPDIDEQKCILFLHGGGYYFGSVNQERQSIQRFARKINGRVLAINYRLSPQYPFPCAIQDALAAYLYLIQPPPEAKHKPVKPQDIVIMGDSAGGGLSLATLQVIRDSGLPQCAGGVLISPWCDPLHSFPSIHTNTKTDVIPYYGMSMHKPGLLWPPPSRDESEQVRADIQRRLQSLRSTEPVTPERVPDAGRQTDLGPSTSAPSVVDEQDQGALSTAEVDALDSQMHFYAPNNLLFHPLINLSRAYLGGLPPLLFTAGDKEVLRDEIIYTAHRAANPSSYPIPDESKRLYPNIMETAAKHPTPTKVHLQVYDGCAHVLPILFGFTTPARYCFRAIASFCRSVTGKQTVSSEPSSPNGQRSPQTINYFGEPFVMTPQEERGSVFPSDRKSPWGEVQDQIPSNNQAGAGPQPRTTKEPEGEIYAGDSNYLEGFAETNIIQERVSIRGVIRPLENDLLVLVNEEDRVGGISQRSFNRYIQGKREFDQKFSGTLKGIKKDRKAELRLAATESDKSIRRLETYRRAVEATGGKVDFLDVEAVKLDPALRYLWNWSWALDEQENPPPSSIVSRRDTSEARQLAKIPRLTPKEPISGERMAEQLRKFWTPTLKKEIESELEHPKPGAGNKTVKPALTPLALEPNTRPIRQSLSKP